MKITIEKDNYDFATESFKTTTIVYETNEVSLFESFQIINKAFSIVAINGKSGVTACSTDSIRRVLMQRPRSSIRCPTRFRVFRGRRCSHS